MSIRIKELRISNNLTQKELADKLQISKSNISKYEAGTVEPNFEQLKILISLFGVTSDYLLGMSDQKNPPSKTAPLKKIEQHLLTLFRSLNEEGQEVAVNVLNGITQQAQYKKSSAAKPIQKQA